MGNEKEILSELKVIKKLFMFFLIKEFNTSSDELGLIAGVDGSTIRDWLPMRKLKKQKPKA